MSRLSADSLQGRAGAPLRSLRDVNGLDDELKFPLYGELLPRSLLNLFSIDPQTLRGVDGLRKVKMIAPPSLGLVRLDLRLTPKDQDSIFFVELADTPYGQLELSLCLINDPQSDRFDINHDVNGRDNSFGTVRRHIAEEVKAMHAGLYPHQVRRGLKMFGPFFLRLERFASRLGIGTIFAEPLSYCNAVRYERYGFDYITGKQKMLRIDRQFAPGGPLYQKLDGSTPFRQRGMDDTIRGRSWAIHDGILDEPWDGVRIYKTVGVDARVNTFHAS